MTGFICGLGIFQENIAATEEEQSEWDEVKQPEQHDGDESFLCEARKLMQGKEYNNVEKFEHRKTIGLLFH